MILLASDPRVVNEVIYGTLEWQLRQLQAPGVSRFWKQRYSEYPGTESIQFHASQYPTNLVNYYLTVYGNSISWYNCSNKSRKGLENDGIWN